MENIQVNGPERYKLAKKRPLAVSVACMAICWPTPGFKGRTWKLCVLNRWGFNFCVCSSPLRSLWGIYAFTHQYNVYIHSLIHTSVHNTFFFLYISLVTKSLTLCSIHSMADSHVYPTCIHWIQYTYSFNQSGGTELNRCCLVLNLIPLSSPRVLANSLFLSAQLPSYI